jgi:hypothetical protein
LMTFEVTATGPVPVARSHVELTMAGFEVVLAGRLAAEPVILSLICLGSLAGIATSVAAWLLTRGTLVLHHPFDPAVIQRQLSEHRCGTLVLPGSLATRCAPPSLFEEAAVENVIALWRAPERLAACPVWPHSATALIDVTAFGEIGLIAAMRGDDGRPAGINSATLPVAAATYPAHGGATEATRTTAGTLALRGPMVPRAAFRQAIVHAGTTFPTADAAGFVDTGYPCRLAKSGALVVTGPPAGVAASGGYRFPLAALQDAVSRIEPAAMIAAVPDRLAGQRLAGVAARREEVCQTLASHGFNPLAINAFRPQSSAADVPAAASRDASEARGAA